MIVIVLVKYIQSFPTYEKKAEQINLFRFFYYYNLKINSLKTVIRQIIVLLISISIFTAASYSNTFDSLLSNTLFKLGISFLWGIILCKYFNGSVSFYTSTIIICVLTLYILLPFGKRELFFLLPNYSFVLTGYFLGYFWIRIKIFAKIFSAFLIFSLLMLNLKVIFPHYAISIIDKTNSVLIGQPLDKFMNNVGIQTKTNTLSTPFEKSKIYLLEFYFENCPPCKIKAKDLLQLGSLSLNNFEIIYIDNGAIDKLSDFMQKDFMNNQKHYYDRAGQLTKNLNINNFPFEIIIDQSGIIRYVSIGYDSGIQNSYIKQTINKIKTLLHVHE